MFNLIKKLLGKKERIGLTLESLEQWFDEKTTPLKKSVNEKISKAKQDIEQEVQKAKENIKNLENAKLLNEKITVKEQQFMEGNRSFYVNRMNLFIESIKLEEKIEESLEKLQKDINELGKSTYKAYQILQHFFENEAYLIAQNIKSIDTNTNILKGIVSDKRIKILEEIKNDILDFKKTLIEEKELKELMKKLENQIVDIETEKKKIRYELVRKEQSKEFKDYNALEVEQHKLREQLEEIRSEMLHFFAVLEHALKKQSKIDLEHENLINEYIESPIKTISDDKNFDIIKILKKIEDNANSNQIDLKDKKREKTLETIKLIDESKITSFLKEQHKLVSELDQISQKMRSTNILEEIEKIKERIDDKDIEIGNLNREITRLNERFSKININQMKNKLKEKISNFFDIELDID